MPRFTHRDAKLVLAVVILALIAAVILLSLTSHPVPIELDTALVGAVGSLAGVSLPAGTANALEAGQAELSAAVPAGDLTSLRHDVDTALSLAQQRVTPGDLAVLDGRLSRLESVASSSSSSSSPSSSSSSSGNPSPLPRAEPAS